MNTGTLGFMRRRGIGLRLIAAFGALLLLYAVSGALVVYATKEIHLNLKGITEVAQPTNAAAYEMEINVIGAGMGVVKYLHRPDPKYRTRFEKDRADFERFLARYREVSQSAEHRKLADRLSELFGDYRDLGQSLMTARDRQGVRRRTFADIAARIDVIANQGANSGGASRLGDGSGEARTFIVLGADLAEILVQVAGDAWESTLARRGWLDQKIAKVRDILDHLAALQLEPAEGRWLAELSAEMEKLIAITREIALDELTIERDLVRFIQLRTEIDSIIDERVQVLTARQLSASNADAQARVHWTYRMLFAIGVFGILSAALATAFLSKTIVGPVQKLAAAAQSIAEGDLTARANLQDSSEIGHLGQAFDDMTDSLESALNALNQSNAELETIVARRTEDLAESNRQLENELNMRRASESALRAAKDVAEVANHAKAVFLANMSHELRTPLNAIIGFAQLMRGGFEGTISSEKFGDYLTDMHESAQHLLKLINDILDISKIETGDVALRESWLEVEPLFKRCAEVIGSRARDSGISITLDVAPQLPLLWADESRMMQIVTNLLDNAVKFTPQGGSVVVAAEVRNSADLEISINDTGIGIAPKDLDDVLEAFAQADSGLARRYDGAGLGLPLAKSFVELHGGKFRLESALGEGTRVSITLPASRLDWIVRTSVARDAV